MFETKPPMQLGNVYYQHWVSGVKGAGSGYNIFIPIKSNSNKTVLDSVYFKGKKAKLEQRDNLFIGRFKLELNPKEDVILSNKPFAEYGNKAPKLPEKIPFELNETECVVSFMENGEVKYFKINEVYKKESEIYQSMPPKNKTPLDDKFSK
ncbi:hypothetical protein [Seonamhaeicola sp. S2-3]|uniref:hypothetical protein n=1 Tax=Seonamhaeicola sp. S2-3 TaxID=1936081 RepID=UPI0012FABB68|nr:hypothetical protein [Seonamhaeicola sp. S2-3]